MSNWLTFLQTQGALIENGVVTSFGEATGDYPDLLQHTSLMSLDNAGILKITGPDASRFLQGQTTCDLQQISVSRSLPGAQCTPKGRMLNSFQLCQADNETLLLRMHRQLVDQTLSGLTKYAVFFKAELENASDQYRPLMLGGPEAATLISETYSIALPDIGSSAVTENGTVISCIGQQQYQLLVPAEQAEARWQQLAAKAKPVGCAFSELLAIRAGIGEVRPDTAEMFIPQMLNLQARDGISFKKGCYTGQEVVARMKYLGKLKRRMYRLRIGGTISPAPGTPCYTPDSEQSVGNVVISAAADADHLELLAVLTETAAASPELRFGENSSVGIKQLPLPYSLE